jgi:transposase InsO family protein
LKKKSGLNLAGQRGRLIIPQDRKEAMKLVNEAVTLGARQRTACELLGLTRRTLQRWQRLDNLMDQRTVVKHVPAHTLSEKERLQIMGIANAKAYCDLPPCQIVPRLADAGIYIASESTFYRILREEKLLKHRYRFKVQSYHKPKELMAGSPNRVWSWDVTYLPTLIKGQFYYLYLVMDVFSRKIVGWTVQAVESSEHASWLMQDICKAERIPLGQVTLHSDNGAIMKGATLLATLQKLGVGTSFSRPAVSNDNAYSESLFKTLKYCNFYPNMPFPSVEETRDWVEKFVKWYNSEHDHSGLKFITPEERHQGHAIKIMSHRRKVYEMAKQKCPERWSRATRNWDLPDYVILNPTGKTDNTFSIKNKEEKILSNQIGQACSTTVSLGLLA